MKSRQLLETLKICIIGIIPCDAKEKKEGKTLEE